MKDEWYTPAWITDPLGDFDLMSGDAHAYDRYNMPARLEEFVNETTAFLSQNEKPVFWKKSITDRIGFVPQGKNVVGPDYSLFK